MILIHQCIGVEGCVIVTGSYDCTAKVWYRSNWALIHKVTLHTDSVWDITIKPNLELEDEEECTNDDPKILYTFATAGLDGAVGVFHITADKNNTLGMRMSFLLQVWKENYSFDYDGFIGLNFFLHNIYARH